MFERARPGPEYRAGPDSAQNTGLGQDPPGPDQNGRGELISPHPCMQNAIRSACREGTTNKKNQNRGEEELPGAEVVAALVLLPLLEAVLVLVLLEAEAVDSGTAAVALLLAAEREFLPPPLSFVSFPFRFLPFLLLPWFSFLLSPSFYLFPLSPLFFFVFPSSVLLLLCSLLFRSLFSRSTFQRFPYFRSFFCVFLPFFPILFPLFLPSHNSFLCFKTSLPFQFQKIPLSRSKLYLSSFPSHPPSFFRGLSFL